MDGEDTAIGTEQVEETNPLSLSDDDFLTLNAPEVEKIEEAPVSEDTQTAATQVGGDSVSGTDTAVTTGEPAADAVKDPVEPVEAPAAPSGSVEEVRVPATPEDHKTFYEKVMAPFKANGKTIELRTPEEAIQLMQQGANYTRRMQDIAPHRKVLAMLQNNGLLDESKLSFFIDLDKKDPEAIKKFIKDSGIDPLEIDTSVEPAYLEGNHRVSDEEVNFRATLDELSSTPEGKKTLQDINTRWDETSKSVLWKNPKAMAIIHNQREYGIYDRIMDEVDRQITLGTISSETPLIEAYRIVGDQLTEAKAFEDLREKHEGKAPQGDPRPVVEPVTKVTPEPVATRTAAPKATVKNDNAAGAATLERTAPKEAKTFVNPLSLSDDEFLKQFSGRL